MGTWPTERSSHHPPERIELTGFLLRRMQKSDAKMVADSVATNVDWLAAWMPWAQASTTVEFQEQRMPEVVSNWDLGTAYEYAAVDLRTDRHLGTFSASEKPMVNEIFSFFRMVRYRASGACRSLTTS